MSEPFRTQRRVEFGDTDMAGIMHFANFFRFMEAAETDFLHSLGMSVAWKQTGERYGFPRVSVSCDFMKPARFEDVIDIDVTVEKVGTKSVTYRFDFSHGGGALAVGRITGVFCRTLPGQPMCPEPIPDDLRAKLQGGQG